MEVDTRKDESLCQVPQCPNRAVAWAVMLRQDRPVGEEPFITVGLCKKHLKILEKEQERRGIQHSIRKLNQRSGAERLTFLENVE